MKVLSKLSIAALATAALAPASFADGREPGSLLVYPIHRSGPGLFTVVCVTNTNNVPATQVSLGGTTTVLYEYVNTVHNPLDSQLPLDCFVVDRGETLTPSDTLCVLTRCHNASAGNEGYLVITATDPSKFKTPWDFDYLIGSELVLTGLGGAYSINAIPFEALPHQYEEGVGLGHDGAETDLDYDGIRDFDGREYEEIADCLFIDSFIAVTGSSLTLINMTGGTKFTAAVHFDIFNDNEFPLSATKIFRCWFEERLQDVSLVFSEDFLRNNTPQDPQELDINCDGMGDFETGWAKIQGIVADSSEQNIHDPALLGAITAGPTGAAAINGGRLLWESKDKQGNGSFLNFSVTDEDND